MARVQGGLRDECKRSAQKFNGQMRRLERYSFFYSSSN
jgi:hypothetical protein